MDLQVVLLAPRVFANANYYKTKLCCHDFTIYNLSCDVLPLAWGEQWIEEQQLCIMHFFIIYSQWWMILSAQWFCTDGFCYQNHNVTLSNALIHFGGLCCEPKEDHLSKNSWKGAHLDGGWICTLCNWRQTQGVPHILASRVHWCTNCHNKRPSLWNQTSGPHFLQRLLQAELFKQHSPRQQC